MKPNSAHMWFPGEGVVKERFLQGAQLPKEHNGNRRLNNAIRDDIQNYEYDQRQLLTNIPIRGCKTC